MNTPTFENLDLACAMKGKAIAEKSSKELENLITQALAVLEEQGIYALFLFLKMREGIGDGTVYQRIHSFLKKTPQQAPLLSDNHKDILTLLKEEIANDLDKLLLARDLVRQTLVYARYHVRVKESPNESTVGGKEKEE
jgi:hypothetical protein